MSEREVRWVLTCEHASCAVPRAYRALGLARVHLRDHIGWDLGAEEVQREIARRLRVPRVASRWSRLLVDCNRAPDNAGLILGESDGVAVPGNARVSAAERRRRIRLYHEPYHAAVDAMVARTRRRHPDAEVRILSLHSFTPVMNGEKRRLDVGVLFDDHPELARRLGSRLRARGWRVRYNEPYSGLAGLIYSARRHGESHRVPYVELEINNALLRSRRGTTLLGKEIATALVEMDRARERRGPAGERAGREARRSPAPVTPRR